MKKGGKTKMHFCRRCGIEIVSANSKTKLCKHCSKTVKSSSLDGNEKIIKAVKHAKSFGITYGQYSELRRIIKELIRNVKC